MALFRYKAIDEHKNRIEGLIEAADENLALDTLAEKGFSVLSLKKRNEIELISKFLLAINRVSLKDLVIFFRQFSVMVSANVTVVESLRILVEQTENIKLKVIISEIADEVDSGSRLSDAFGKRPEVFSEFYINVIRSGETSGKLDQVLNYIADEAESDYNMMAKIRGAMLYPLFIIVGLLTVGVLMMIFVIPQLVSVLKESETELPLTTQILINTSNFLQSYWWSLLVLILVFVLFYKYAYQTEQGKIIIDKIKLQLPVFGKLLSMIYVVRFTKSMSTLITSGVTITKSLEITSRIVGNRVYYDLIAETCKQVEDGSSISSVFSQSAYVPKMVSQMMIIGEETGKLDMILAKIADFYNKEISNMTANLTVLLEPIIITTIGIGVGIMVAGIILPMYSLSLAY
jgi:type IV pilus assembly protein PilC